MRICFDLDGVLCTGLPYTESKPVPGVDMLLQFLHQQGHTIIIYTARKMHTASGNAGKALADIGRLTFDQLATWGFVFDEIHFGKPCADVYIDDKSIASLHDLRSFIGVQDARTEGRINFPDSIDAGGVPL